MKEFICKKKKRLNLNYITIPIKKSQYLMSYNYFKKVM